MINPPPDPTENEAAELRSEGGGMPEHPAKAADPVTWAEETAEREKKHAAGYPTGSPGRAIADVVQSVEKIAAHFRPETRDAAITIGLATAAAVALHLLTRRKSRRYLVRNGEIYYK